MTIYNDLQKCVSEFRTAQDEYWKDLTNRLDPFKQNLESYFGVEGMYLYTPQDKKVPIVTFGRIEGQNVISKPAALLDKNEENSTLEFGIKIALSRANSEMLDTELCLPCNISRKDDAYYITVSGTSVECTNRGSSLDFTDVFDYVIGRIHIFMDASTFK